jgi:hypothetical protein
MVSGKPTGLVTKASFLSVIFLFFQKWSRNFGPVVKVDRMTKEVIQNKKPKEPFA